MRWFENPPRRHPGEVFQTCPNGDGGVRCLCCGPRTRWEIRSLGCLVNTSLSPQTSWRRRLGGARSRLLSLDRCSCNCSHTWQFGCTLALRAVNTSNKVGDLGHKMWVYQNSEVQHNLRTRNYLCQFSTCTKTKNKKQRVCRKLQSASSQKTFQKQTFYISSLWDVFLF